MAVDVLLRDELVRELGGRRAFARALDDGSWQRVLRGTYVPGQVVPDLRVRCAAAARLLPEHAHVADRCLLWLLGVDVLPPGPPLLEVVVPRDAVPPRRTHVRARITDLPARDRTVVGRDGLRCLRTVRAGADLLRLLPLPQAVVVADAVQHAGLCDRAALQAELAASAAGLRGVVQARRALELSDARAESPPESLLRLALVQAGLRPVPQFVVLDEHGRFVARVDLALPAQRLALEYDGRAVHEREDVFVRDRRRANDLARAGWTVLRFTAADLRGGAARPSCRCAPAPPPDPGDHALVARASSVAGVPHLHDRRRSARGKGGGGSGVGQGSAPLWHTGLLRAPVPRTAPASTRTRRLLRPRGTAMKADIHPTYVDTTVSCTCGNTFTTRSTNASGSISADVCSACHPFYTGKQKILDTGGRVARFEQRFGKRSK
jgi:ribosomal protein L31